MQVQLRLFTGNMTPQFLFVLALATPDLLGGGHVTGSAGAGAHIADIADIADMLLADSSFT